MLRAKIKLELSNADVSFVYIYFALTGMNMVFFLGLLLTQNEIHSMRGRN
jgi:hypothetical protein